ncbi:hypothetical protein evm_001904 [Chilo suppressalis]|nr:hypothetical protein evm_001904 [Chilo suppressalis]
MTLLDDVSHKRVESSGEPASSETTAEPMDNENTSGATIDEQSEPNLDENGDEVLPETPPIRFHPRRRSHRVVRAMRARHTQPRHLGQLIEELETLQEQFAPYRAGYVSLLRAANEPEPPLYTDDERASNQRTVDMVSDLMHSFAHAYHAVSDITFTVGQRNPRLFAEAAVSRHLIPMQAHINVIQSNRRQQSTPNTSTTTGSGSAENAAPTQATAAATATTTTTSSTNAEANATQTTRGTQQSATAGRNTTQPTVNINIQPEPISYQLEIETRVPIAFPLESALSNGLNNARTPGQSQSPRNQGPQTQSQQNQSNQQEQNQNQQNQANRRPMLSDFENLLRGLAYPGGLGGVEVVMSMEEIPQGVGVGLGNLSNLVGASANTANNAQQASTAHRPEGGAPSAEVLQNLLSTVIRQGLIPGVEGVAVQIPNSLAVQLHNFIETQAQTLGQNPGQPSQGQNQSQTQSSGSGQAQSSGPGQAPSSGPGQAQSHGSRQTQGQEQTAEQPSAQTSERFNLETGVNANSTPIRQGGPMQFFRTANTGRAQAQALALASLVYDRYLQCDSQHTRRRLQRRREHHQQQMEQQERTRAERIASINIEALRHRRLDLTPRHMTNIVHLLNSSPSPASWFNALMVAIARQQYMSDLLHASGSEPALLPHEFQELKLLLRSYVQHLIIRSGNNESDNAFQSVADYLIEQNEEFIENMGNVTGIRSDIDPVESIRALVRSRLPAVIACVMSDSSTEMFVVRFYAMFLRIYSELCALICHMCDEGEHGLRQLYMAYLDEVVQQFDEPIRSTMRVFGLDNMVGIMGNIANHQETIAQFVRRRDGVMPNISRPEPMEEATATPPNAQDEPMQTTPPSTPAVPAEPTTAPTTVTRPESQTFLPAQSPILPCRTNHPSRNKATRSTSTTSTQSASNNDQNIRIVPPMVIVQHWGEEWVPVFTRDQQEQRPEPAEPYSDAYLSGMPSRKRRCVRQSRPPATLDGLMNESVREASSREGRESRVVQLERVERDSAIRAAFRERLRHMARARASGSDDYDPHRYASAARFLSPPRQKVHGQIRTDGNPTPYPVQQLPVIINRVYYLVVRKGVRVSVMGMEA